MTDTTEKPAQSASDAPKAKAKASRPKPAKGPAPNQIPYMRQGFTFADRERELSLMVNLLDAHKRNVLEELDFVQNCNVTRQYPGIVIGDI